MAHTYRLASPRSFPVHSDWVLPEGKNAYETGLRALRAGFLESARAIFEALATREPLHPELLLSLAETHLAAGGVAQARALLAGVPEDLRSNASFHGLQADLALARGNASGALAEAFLASELAPAAPGPRFLMARILWIGGSEHEAELSFLSLAGEPECGDRALAWAVFCAWRKGQTREVENLLGNLRDDDAVGEGLRELGQRRMGIPWVESDRVHPGMRTLHAQRWARLLDSGRGSEGNPGEAAAGLR